MMKNILTAVLALTVSSVCFADTITVKYNSVDDNGGSVNFDVTVKRVEKDKKTLASSCTLKGNLPTTNRFDKDPYDMAPLTHEFPCGNDVVKMGAVYFVTVGLSGLKGSFVDLELTDENGYRYIHHELVDATPTSKN